MGSPARWLGTALFLFAAGCVVDENAPAPCSTTGACLPGFECVEGICQACSGSSCPVADAGNTDTGQRDAQADAQADAQLDSGEGEDVPVIDAGPDATADSGDMDAVVTDVTDAVVADAQDAEVPDAPQPTDASDVGVDVVIVSDGGADGGVDAADVNIPDVDVPDADAGQADAADTGVVDADTGIVDADTGVVDTGPDGGDAQPDGGDALPDGGDALPDGGDALPDGGDALPDGGDALPDGGDAEPDGGDAQPDGGDAATPDAGGAIDPLGVLRINEVDFDVSVLANPYVEIFNSAAEAVDLTDLDLELGDSTGVVATINLDTTISELGPGGYLVVGPALLGLSLPFGTDFVVYNGAFPDGTDGGARIVDVGRTAVPDSVGLGTASLYVEGSQGPADTGDESISRCPNAADSEDNSVDFVRTSTRTPGAANDCL